MIMPYCISELFFFFPLVVGVYYILGLCGSYSSLLVRRHVHGKRVLVVTNNTIAPLYLDKVVDALTRGNPNVSVDSVILPDGEKYKDMVGI